ncbi:putative P-loop containing nucleoside triphosphate hydrolase, leucine-rich repeat domain superfamily [Helianthus annuus]|nr:putative P-loop containing nucleoside triphosphate hydrolase, leucine-rich repeat domain superfamily [Helianthus annuus]
MISTCLFGCSCHILRTMDQFTSQIPSQITGPVITTLIGHITKHIEHVTSSTKRVADMISKMEVLKGKSKDVSERMERNQRNRKEIPARVEGWLGDVKKVSNEVRNISTDTNGCLDILSAVNIGCLDILKRYRAGRNAFKTIEEIERLINEEEKMRWSDTIIPLGRVDSKPSTSTLASSSSSSSSCETTGFKSRDEKFKQALRFLQQDDKNSEVIALCGMGGVGKTTMMEQLKKVAQDKQLFKWIAKSVVGQNPNMLSVQNDIAAYLKDCDLPNASKLVRAEHLTKTIAKLSEDNEKVLIILDDVWKKIELKDIGLTSPLPKGVKLLLTSRYSDICKQVAVDANSDLQEVKVDVLEEAEAHKFFSGITGVLEEHDPEKYQIGCRIAKKCGYLPLAIKHIASTLKSEEEIFVWRDTLTKRLKNNRDDENVQEIIKISYERLEKDEECKAIFLHCGLFPEDANISKEDLTRHAWGLKLLNDVSTFREARDRTKTCVQKLINANLLINGDLVGCVKMHDLVLAFVLGIVSNGDSSWIINHGDVSKWGRDEINKSYDKMSLRCTGLSEFPREFKYPNLSLLLLMNGDESLKFSENFYENMEHLQVIAYYEMSYPLLPRSLKCSTYLKALCLHSCKLMFDDCSFIGDLVNLEVLSFAHCAIRKLPATIANLRKLKLLDLTGCVDLHIDDGVFKNLVSLEELYMRVSQGKAVRFTNASFEELKILSSQLHALEVEFVEKNTWPENFSFKKLDKFKISIGCQLGGYSYEKTLKLVTESSSQLQDCKINEMFTKTEHLHLQVNDMRGLEDISICPYGQHSFCSLIELEVSNSRNLIYLFPMSVARGLKKLERLSVLSCSFLKALVKDDRREINSVGEMIKFEKLKFLSLKKLPELEILFSIENVVELPQLVELEVEGLPNFTSIYPDKDNSCALLNSQVRISKLEELSIESMENLKQIWGVSSEEDDNNNNISMLRKILVGSCDSIEVIFNIDLECVGQVELLTNINLRSIEDGENKSTKLTCAFEALESIDIFYCKRFRNIFTPTNTNCRIHMPALTDIKIEYTSRMDWNWNWNWNWQEEEVSSREERDDSSKSTVAFPSSLMYSFHSLQELCMMGYDGVDAVFEIESSSGGRQLVTNTTNQQPLLPHLQNLELKYMHSMDHVWKCSNWKRFLILQKQSSFQNLTTMYIDSCKRIKYLFSPLMAKLLLNLKEIEIKWCNGMEEVVSNRDDKDEEMTTTYTTTTFFPHLHSLSFQRLQNLKRIGGGVIAKSSTGITTHDQFEF